VEHRVRKRPAALLAALVLLCAALAAAGGWYYYSVRHGAGPAQPPTAGGAPPPGGPAQPPPEVGVVEVRPAEVPVPVEFAGRVAGYRDVEIRAQVGGPLLSREFEEGARVEAGQLLFRIDPAPYRVALDRATAELEQAQATLRQAEADFARIDELVRRRVGTRQQLDEATARRDQARASVHLAEAEVASARLNLGYTTVTAPVRGVTALESPPVGTLVLAQQTLLTTITQLDPAYVTFSFTDAEGRAFRELNERRATPITERDLIVELRYGDGTAYPSPGRIDTAARRVDPRTGTIEARAVFPNPDGALLPGQFVRVAVRGVTIPDAIVVPERAVSQGPQGPSVLVVGEGDTAQARPVRLGEEVAAGWVVAEGLRPGERVIVDGVIRARPGAPVRPVPAQPPGPTLQATADPAAAGGRRP
jgi:membrane fusion protein, multidrug efflux system